MPRFARTRTALAALALLASGCSSTSSSFDSDDRESIETTAEAWRLFVSQRDVSSVGALYTRDAVLMPPNSGVVRGRAGIEDFFAAFPEIQDLKTVLLEIEGDGDLAYVWGTYSMNLVLPGSSPPVADRGKYVEIWRRQEDGSWRIDRDIFNSDLPVDPGA